MRCPERGLAFLDLSLIYQPLSSRPMKTPPPCSRIRHLFPILASYL